jgi:hypothetical protein
MTRRTEASPPTPIEQASAAVIESINAAITAHYCELQVGPKQRIPEQEFRRIIALYFTHKTLADWCRDLHIADATDPQDRPDHSSRDPRDGGEA